MTVPSEVRAPVSGALLSLGGFEQRRERMPRKPQGKRISTADGSVAVRGKAPNGAGSVYPIADGSWRANWTRMLPTPPLAP